MSNLKAWALLDLNETKEALDIATADHDAKLNGYINRATAVIEAYCKRRFILTTYTDEEYDGTGTQDLQLKNYPVTALTELNVRGGSYDSPAWDDVDTSLFTYDADSGIVHNDAGFTKGTKMFQITFSAGYAFANLPDDLKEAAIEIVSYLFGRRKATPGMKSERLGNYSYTMDGITSSGIVKQLGLDSILDNYRTPTV